MTLLEETPAVGAAIDTIPERPIPKGTPGVATPVGPRAVRPAPAAVGGVTPSPTVTPATGAIASPGRGYRVAKRVTDLVGASLLLVVTAPILVLAAVAVRVGDGGPVLFRQQRVGRDGRRFTILKFRTMVPDAEERVGELADRNLRNGPLFKATDDPRVTPIGRLLRATSIDELPQLLNVLAGHMSLVGPRPALPDEVARFDPVLRRRHVVRPGVTGLWQVTSRDDPSFERYRAADLRYVRRPTMALDLWIMGRTARDVARSVRRAATGR